MFLLQAAVNVTDVTFRLMDVVYIILGTASIVSGIVIFRYNQTKMNDRIDTERDKFKAELFHHEEKYKALEARIQETENSLDNIEKNIDAKIGKIFDLLRDMNQMVSDMEKRVLERMLDKKQST